MLSFKERFGEIFKIEMEGWCYGIQQYSGEIFPGLIHAIIKEMEFSFKTAFEKGHSFDILVLSDMISSATKRVVHEKEICFSILARLPVPSELNEEAQFAMAQVIDQVEQNYGGVLRRLSQKWGGEDLSNSPPDLIEASEFSGDTVSYLSSRQKDMIQAEAIKAISSRLTEFVDKSFPISIKEVRDSRSEAVNYLNKLTNPNMR